MFQVPGGARQRVPNTLLSSPALSVTYGNDIRLAADSTINGVSAIMSNLGVLYIQPGQTLHTTGLGVSFTGTTSGDAFDAPLAAGTYKLDVGGTELGTGPLSDGGNAVAIEKRGGGTLVLSAASVVSNTTFNLFGGKVLAVGQTDASGPIGTRPINMDGIAGGDAVLALAGVDATPITFNVNNNNRINLIGNGGIMAGPDYTGQGGAFATGAVTLQGQLTVPAGKTFAVGAANGYTLTLDPAFRLTNNGTVSSRVGSVSLTSTNFPWVDFTQGRAVGSLDARNRGTLVLADTFTIPAASLTAGPGGTLRFNAANYVSGSLDVAVGSFILGDRYALDNATLSFNGGTIGASTALSGGRSVTNPIAWGAAGGVSVANEGVLALTSNVNFGATQRSIYDAGGKLVLRGVVDNGGLALSGFDGWTNAGPTLANANTYVGGTNLTNTIVRVTNSKSLGTGPITFNRGGLAATIPLTGANAIPNAWGHTGGDFESFFRGGQPIELSGAATWDNRNYLHPTEGTRLTISGKISQSNNTWMEKQNDGTLVLTSPESNFTGGERWWGELPYGVSVRLWDNHGKLELQSSSTWNGLDRASGYGASKGPLGIGLLHLGRGDVRNGHHWIYSGSSEKITIHNSIQMDGKAGFGGGAGGIEFSGNVYLGSRDWDGRFREFWLLKGGDVTFSGNFSGVNADGNAVDTPLYLRGRVNMTDTTSRMILSGNNLFQGGVEISARPGHRRLERRLERRRREGYPPRLRRRSELVLASAEYARHERRQGLLAVAGRRHQHHLADHRDQHRQRHHPGWHRQREYDLQQHDQPARSPSRSSRRPPTPTRP